MEESFLNVGKLLTVCNIGSAAEIELGELIKDIEHTSGK